MTNSFLSQNLFGNLFCDPKIAAEFGEGAFLRRMLAFETAWTRALSELGDVPFADADAALKKIATSDVGDLSCGSDKDGLPVPAFVAALRHGLPAGPARAIHTGATSQDVLDTAMVLTCQNVLDKLDERLSAVLGRLEDLLAEHGDNALMARTRMQAALPARASLRLGAWKRPLSEQQLRLGHLRKEIGSVQIGGAIGLRDVPPDKGQTVAALVAKELNLSVGPVWHSDRSRFVSMGHFLVLLSGSLGKIGQDIALMSQQGLDELDLAGGGGSSAMPHKQNPILAEAMVSLARFVGGQQGILAQAMIHEQERSGSAWALEWLTLPSMAEATGASLRHAENLLASIERIGARD